jgi:dTDP-glucose 4,6-dehydratase
MRTIITGGAGFIGTNVVLSAISRGHDVLVIDSLTYAACLENLDSVKNNKNYTFENIDIRNRKKIKQVFDKFQPEYIFHLAAESHVDRSIESAVEALSCNITGTYVLIDVFTEYWLSKGAPSNYKFHHISTDEVFGSVHNNLKFNETTRYDPQNPYSASKASSDHLVRSWINTHGTPAVITNCSNNYGPYQFPEKLIPLTITNALAGKKIRIYGNGKQIRDWIYVDDHVDALFAVMEHGTNGETYMIGSNNEARNIDIVTDICKLLDGKVNSKKLLSNLITFVPDRPGHDKHYAVNAEKICKELSWKPKYSLSMGLEKTVDWYLENSQWAKKILNK